MILSWVGQRAFQEKVLGPTHSVGQGVGNAWGMRGHAWHAWGID